MSSGNVPYHLRLNKHIERVLFIDLLSRICGNQSSSYAYISMGGPQLEDHKLIHQNLDIRFLFSFESEKNVHARQVFNQRPSCLKCINKPINEFIDGFEGFVKQEGISDKKLIIWLDYAPPDRKKQLIEYQKLLGKLQEQDIIKVTVNANIDTFGERQSGETHEAAQVRRLEKIKSDLDEYLMADLTSDQMTDKGLIPVLCHVLEVSTEKGLSIHPHIKPVLLSLFSYQDGHHKMLTATMCLVGASDLNKFMDELHWDYLPSNWRDVRTIDVPILTAKERLEIDSRLPADDIEKLHGELPFMLDIDIEKSKDLLREYAKHYRRYPSYFQVVL